MIFCRTAAFINKGVGVGLFLLGLWLVVLNPLGPGLSRLPGDMGDSRFNLYILEHFYRWLIGLDPTFWTAPFFYPFPLTTAFSDNFLGSAPFYVIFRLVNLPAETALQGWYCLGFGLNFAAAFFALSRFRFWPLAAASGAFFFAFGLPMLNQEGHFQLLYRFCVPIAGYVLWAFTRQPRLRLLVLFCLAVVWQFFFSIYIGFFLILFLVALVALLPLSDISPTPRSYAIFWPVRIRQAWLSASLPERALSPVFMTALALALAALLAPYIQATQAYHFSRQWNEIVTMIPRPRSYLLADNSLLWGKISAGLGGIFMRGEHQLFPGGAVLLLGVIAFIMRFKTENRRLAFLHLAALVILTLFTINIHGFVGYEFLAGLPGVESIRAVSRIQLVLMWPLGVFSAYALDGMLRRPPRLGYVAAIFVVAFVALLVLDSVAFRHATFSIADARQRITDLRGQIPSPVPPDPILFLRTQPNEPTYLSEIDEMFLAQSLGWLALDGYSGNFPPGYQPAKSCVQLPKRILLYMRFAHAANPAVYFNLIRRVVPVGFNDCDLAWWKFPPSISADANTLPEDLLAAIHLKGTGLHVDEPWLAVDLEVENQSNRILPAESTTGNAFQIVGRFYNLADGQLMSKYETRRPLDLDIPSHATSHLLASLEPPKEPGRYRVEISPEQAGIDWPADLPKPIVKLEQVIVVDAEGHITIMAQ